MEQILNVAWLLWEMVSPHVPNPKLSIDYLFLLNLICKKKKNGKSCELGLFVHMESPNALCHSKRKSDAR